MTDNIVLLKKGGGVRVRTPNYKLYICPASFMLKCRPSSDASIFQSLIGMFTTYIKIGMYTQVSFVIRTYSEFAPWLVRPFKPPMGIFSDAGILLLDSHTTLSTFIT
jgi:hypothetical protein